MSTRRLLTTTAGMVATGAALSAVTPDPSWLTGTGLDLQRAVDAAGPETLVLSAVAGLAWLTWAWGALGLLLTALSALPGAAGALAGTVTRLVLPAGARRAAALALGLGLAGGPLLAGCTAAAMTPAPAELAIAGAEAPVADWPAGSATPPTPSADVAPAGVPDWPPTAGPPAAHAPRGPEASAPDGGSVADWPRPAPGDHVVVRGECLWDIAAAHLRDRSAAEPSDGEVARAVLAWWRANAAVIGPDPDLILPGQVLTPP